MNFSQALELLKGGALMKREEWADDNYLFIGNNGLHLSLGLIDKRIDEIDGLDSINILADDWEEVKDDKGQS